MAKIIIAILVCLGAVWIIYPFWDESNKHKGDVVKKPFILVDKEPYSYGKDKYEYIDAAGDAHIFIDETGKYSIGDTISK